MNRRSITACALALAFLAVSGRVALAQDRGQHRGQDSAQGASRGRPDTTRESPNGANSQGGHTPTDQDRAVIAADQARKAAQAEQDRQAAQGRSTNGQDRQPAQGRSYNGQDRQGQDRQPAQGRSYNGQDRQPAQGRSYNGQDRQFTQAQGEPSFTDRDRQATREWYQQHRNRLGPGWRDRDRLSPSLEGRLRRGERLDPQLRQQMYWLPPDLARMYGPAPRGYRYAIIGGNIVLLDDGYQVHDVFRLELHF